MVGLDDEDDDDDDADDADDGRTRDADVSSSMSTRSCDDQLLTSVSLLDTQTHLIRAKIRYYEYM
jgi:hypothetical protein